MPDPDSQVTAAIIQHPRTDLIEGYEAWLDEIVPVCKSFNGHLGVTVIRPVPGITDVYTILLRFDTVEHLTAWFESTERRALLERVRPLLVEEEARSIHGGLDFWFTPPNANVRIPTRWKQALITWSAIFPLVLLVSLAVGRTLEAMSLTIPAAFRTLVTTGLVVLLMVYIVMPRYTGLVRSWLYR